MNIIGSALAGMLMLAEQSGSTVGPGHGVVPKYHRYNFESRCGPHVLQVRFQNRPVGRSRVDQVLIDGKSVPHAAKTLDRFVARESIDSIEIRNCGDDPQRPRFRVVMELNKSERQRADRQSKLYFQLVRKGEGWRFSVD